MFNDSLTLEQCERLVGQLSATAFPFQCAHGRYAWYHDHYFPRELNFLPIQTLYSSPYEHWFLAERGAAAPSVKSGLVKVGRERCQVNRVDNISGIF
jgi:hypothetical protein